MNLPTPLPGEIWHALTNRCAISNLGRARSAKGKTEQTLCRTQGGYTLLHTCGEWCLHRHVAKTFVPGFKHGYDVHHKDENRQNNRAENLQWVKPARHRRRFRRANLNCYRRLRTRGVSHKAALTFAGMQLNPRPRAGQIKP